MTSLPRMSVLPQVHTFEWQTKGMPTVIVSGLFGLAGVLLGGFMTMMSARWQSTNSERARLTELKLQLEHERILRDESEKRSSILEFIAALERLNSEVVQVTFDHHHGGENGRWPDHPCTLDSLTEAKEAGTQFYNLLLSKGPLITSDLDVVVELWEDIYRFTDHVKFDIDNYKYGQVKKAEYCNPGGKVACLEMPIRDATLSLRSELGKLLAAT